MVRKGKLGGSLWVAGALTVLIAVMVVPGYAGSAEAKSVVKVTGAQSMYPRVHAYSVIFMKRHPEVKVDVVNGATVDAGMAALLDGSADVAMASRRITHEEIQAARERGVELVERLIGYGGIILLVNGSNRVKDLSVEQVKKVLTGEINQWSVVGGAQERITVVRTAMKTHPGTLRFIEKDFLGRNVTGDALVVSTFPEVVRKVAEIPGALGYVRIRDVYETPETRTVAIQMLKVRENPAMAAVMPSRDTVKDGTYPLKRPYFLYHSSRASEDVKMLVDYLVSKGWGTLSDAALKREK